MPEPRSKSYAEELLKGINPAKATPGEGGPTRQVNAFGLTIKYKDGLCEEGFSWADYRGHQWRDENGKECLEIIFGARVVTVEGFNLSSVLWDVEHGECRVIPELTSRKVTELCHSNPENVAIVESVRIAPSFKDIVSEIKGEDDHDQGRHARRVQR